jgi:hypothetical protein
LFVVLFDAGVLRTGFSIAGSYSRDRVPNDYVPVLIFHFTYSKLEPFLLTLTCCKSTLECERKCDRCLFTVYHHPDCKICRRPEFLERTYFILSSECVELAISLQNRIAERSRTRTVVSLDKSCSQYSFMLAVEQKYRVHESFNMVP